MEDEMKTKNFSGTILILIVLLLITITSSGIAQDRQFATKGVTELTGTVSYSNFTSVNNGETGDAISIFTIAPQVGYFVVDGLELGLGTGVSLLPGFSVLSPEDDESTSFLQIFFAPSYNIKTENKSLYPFIEAQAGYTSISSDGDTQSGFSYGGRAGLKIVAVEHLLVSISAQYLLIKLNESGETERDGFNYLTFGIGVSGYF
jgi:hypothetical protein